MRLLCGVSLLLISVLAACSGGNQTTSDQETAPPPSSSQGSGGQPANANQDDPDNPWRPGFRWSGTLGTEFRVRVASRDANYDALQAEGRRPYQANSLEFQVREDRNIFLASVFVEGLKLRATIRSNDGSLKIEMFDGRMVDPNDPLGGVEVRNVLSSGEASGRGGVIELEAGKPIEIAEENW